MNEKTGMKRKNRGRARTAPAVIIGLAAVMFFFTSPGPVSACEFTYLITGPDHSNTRIIPGIPVTLTSGSEYSLSFSYREDHRNCLVPPEETLFLVEEERWRVGKDYLALELLEPVSWDISGREYSTDFSFKALRPGTWTIQVVRECTRGGYDQGLIFTVR